MIFFIKKNVREVSFTDSHVFNADEQSAVVDIVFNLKRGGLVRYNAGCIRRTYCTT